MPTDCISYQSSGYFTPLIKDYLEQKEQLKPLYNRFPSMDHFKQQLLEKASNYTQSHRDILAAELHSQNLGIGMSHQTQTNIDLLRNENTFTITTGHQLNLFTGPLYFLYKIISAINLSKHLKLEYPEYNFVPVYWMATEDHDFEEINYFTFRGKKFRWNRQSSGPVGKLDTAGLEDILKLLSLDFGTGKNADYLRKLFQNAYLKHQNLAEATRFLANELFAEYGLVILDADCVALKKLFIPYAKRELIDQVAYQKVSETNKMLAHYNIQVNPREINLFYIKNNLRERIIFSEENYFVNNTDIQFTPEEIITELNDYPQRFSPNVVMRPLYEEVILPNLCYIGGGGEIAYWLELKSYFEASDVTFPILLVRNSVLLATKKQAKKADALNLSWADLFLKQQELLNKKTHQLSEFPIDLSPQKEQLKQQFKLLYELVQKTDKSFSGAVKAQEAKQIKGLEMLEKRLLKAQKRKHAAELDRIVDLQNELFPFQGLQERQKNFSEFYIEAGESLIHTLVGELKPLEHEFKILVL
ncbi:MAG TPA: bacillithiol biosynthesis cysteine-adding enzyme BshC [Flavobacterium sp.]